MFYFIKQIFIFGPCGAKNKNFEPAYAGSGPDGPEKFFASKKSLSSLTLAPHLRWGKSLESKKQRAKPFVFYSPKILFFFFGRGPRPRPKKNKGVAAAAPRARPPAADGANRLTA